MSNSSVAPFVKWAGGKRQLIPQIKERMPEKYNNYYEPFVGGGAVTFELLPANALINDINKALINAYKQICNAPEAFLKAVSKLDTEMWEDGKEYYYSLREHYNDKLMKAEYDVELAALFVFINKHCFNGLYRVNGKGLFNVPYNNSRRASVDEEVIMATSKYLQGVTFYQVNHHQAQRLYEAAISQAEITKEDTVLDLYCGVGTITLAMSKAAGKVIGVEVIPQAVEDAKDNARRNGVTNAEFLCADAGAAALELERKGIKADVVVVDPPRKGLNADAIEAIARFAPRRLVYVSCDPATLARDAALLKEKGFRLQNAQAFDLFPRCAHVESVVCLTHISN